MIYSVLYSENASKDIDDIFEYIAYELLSPENAKGQVARIIKSIDSLEKFPFRYKLYYEEPWLSKGLRCFSVDNYMIFYYPVEKDKIVRVIRIMYSSRDIKEELSK